MKTLPIILLLTIILHHSHADQTLIRSTCKKSTNYQLCVSMLQADNRSSPADVRGLVGILLDAVKYKVEEATRTIQELQGSAQQEPEQSKALQHCTQAFQAVLQTDIPKTQQSVKLGNPDLAEIGIANMMTEVNGCYANMKANGRGVALAREIVSLVFEGVNSAIQVAGSVIKAIASLF